MYFKLVIRKGTARLIVSSDSEDDRYDTLEYAEGSIAGSTWSRSGREDVVVWLAKGCPEPPPAVTRQGKAQQRQASSSAALLKTPNLVWKQKRAHVRMVQIHRVVQLKSMKQGVRNSNRSVGGDFRVILY